MHATLCDMITDLVQNSFEAAAKHVVLTIKQEQEEIIIRIEDDGKGMDAQTLERAKDPFFTDGVKHVHRKVGLGLPFLYQTAEMTEGKANVESEPGKGTTVEISLKSGHIDLPEFGNTVSMLSTLLSYSFNGNLQINRSYNGAEYTLDKNELIEILGDLADVESLMLLREFIDSHEMEISNR